jgi:crotonobetainyl-CoA:carnitine CoA-transferase CaiB-like acyl-CoA transferase
MAGPLAGIRVLDLTTMVAGPVATRMLADQGADVIKVESPSGDLTRHFNPIRNGMSAAFLSCNRNKRSLAVDLKAAQGLTIVQKLIATVDVLVHNFRPGAAERLGLGEDAVREIRHDIVYVSISGFGESGPYANQRAYDPVIQALSGLAEIQTDRDTGRPRMVRTIIADNTTALTAAQAITAALFARERSGQSADPGPNHAWSVDELLTDIKGLLDALNFDRVHYIGESIGGLLGIACAVRWPERFKRLTLCAGAIRSHP